MAVIQGRNLTTFLGRVILLPKYLIILNILLYRYITLYEYNNTENKIKTFLKRFEIPFPQKKYGKYSMERGVSLPTEIHV